MPSKISKNSENLAGDLHSAAIHLLRKLRREDSSSGLNAPRLSALSVIVFAGPVTLGDLARAEQVSPPTMTRIVNALAKQGLVTRTRSADDARSTLLNATPAGKKLLFAGRERRVRALARQIALLPPNDRLTLEAATAILKHVVNEI
jgi:DNA-binding MarR family transcriptional regulator